MIVDAPKVINALASPSSVPPWSTDEVATLHADSTTVRGSVRHRSRSYTVSGPSASASVENSGLSARYEPWHARWARPLRPRACRTASAVAAPPTSTVGRRYRLATVSTSDGAAGRSGPAASSVPRRPVAPIPASLATAHPMSDGETDTGRPDSPGKRGPRQAVQGTGGDDDERMLGATDAGGHEPVSESVAELDERRPRRRLGCRRPLDPVEPMNGERARVDVVGEARQRAELVQPRPAADDGDRVELIVDHGVLEQQVISERGDGVTHSDRHRVTGGLRPPGVVADRPLELDPLAPQLDGVAARPDRRPQVLRDDAQLSEQLGEHVVARGRRPRRQPEHPACRLDPVEQLTRAVIADGQPGAEGDERLTVPGGERAELQRARGWSGSLRPPADPGAPPPAPGADRPAPRRAARERDTPRLDPPPAGRQPLAGRRGRQPPGRPGPRRGTAARPAPERAVASLDHPNRSSRRETSHIVSAVAAVGCSVASISAYAYSASAK